MQFLCHIKLYLALLRCCETWSRSFFAWVCFSKFVTWLRTRN